MTIEDKELLLKDLSARLPYGVIINPVDCGKAILIGIKDGNPLLLDTIQKKEYDKPWDIEYIKPYLRQMSSMTEDEYKEMQMVLGGGEYAALMNKTLGLELWLESVDTDPTIWFDSLVDVQDWLNAHHFDYRGLIEKGLALEAPEGMYKL